MNERMVIWMSRQLGSIKHRMHACAPDVQVKYPVQNVGSNIVGAYNEPTDNEKFQRPILVPN